MERLKIVKGNTFETLVEVRSYTYDGEELTSFDLRNCSKIVVKGKVSGYSRTQKFTIQDANHILITWNGKSMRVGNYTLEVTGKLGSVDWRFYDKTPIFLIVNTNAEAYIPENCVVTDNCYRVNKQSLYIATSSSSTPGEKGEKGDKGDPGPQGPQGEKGEKGDKGDTGAQGPAGADGKDGKDGVDGQDGLDGQDGADGITPHIDETTGNWFIGDTDTGVHALGPAGQDGQDGLDGANGQNGSNGQDGSDGADGITPTVSVTTITGGHNVAFSYGTGDSRNTNFDVMDGTLASQAQADWNQSDNTQPDYIKNKPTIPTVPTNVSSFNNDAGYLTSVPNTCVTSTITGLKIEVVASLPASPDSNTIYIVQ